MKIKSFVFAVLMMFSTLFSGTANAVIVSLVPDKFVGLDDGSYFAGIVTLDIDGKEYLAMNMDPLWAFVYKDEPSYIPFTWEGTLSSIDDISSSWDAASRERLVMASQLFLYGLLGYDPADPLWAAGHNEMVWNIGYDYYWSDYGSRVYDEATGITLSDIYTYDYLVTGLDPDFDPTGVVYWLGGDGFPFLVYTSAVPVPPAIGLFASGLIGLIAVARKKRNMK